MRGYSVGSRLDRRSFIVLDRLYETLDQKISIWSKDMQDLHSLFKRAGAFKLFSRGENEAAKNHREEADRDILLQRMIVLYDLASAFSYMHQNRYESALTADFRHVFNLSLLNHSTSGCYIPVDSCTET